MSVERCGPVCETASCVLHLPSAADLAQDLRAPGAADDSPEVRSPRQMVMQAVGRLCPMYAARYRTRIERRITSWEGW